MRTSLISTATLHNSPRSNLAEMQKRLSDATKEVSTGRHADVGLKLGDRTGRNVALRRDLGNLEAMITSNSLAKARISQTHTVLGSMGETMDAIQQNLTTYPDTNQTIRLLETQSKEGMQALIRTMNSTDGRVYLFGGINSSQPPMADYDGAPRTAVDNALIAKFGLSIPPQNDSAGLAAITPADMQDFIDNEFDALFQDPDWGTTWSSASDEAITSRISPDETVRTSITANTDATRRLAKALTMLGEFNMNALDPDTRKVVYENAITTLNSGLTETISERANLGHFEKRINVADERMHAAIDIVETRINAFETVDPVDAKVEVDQLTTQIEMSYSLTTQIMRLSIMKYA
ncbi:flagellar hook-associated family protein [Amorphus orientalis]|uniref:Flagellin n=1 Tax=Amorphus orientalis TaxID=649198 RepID=A0AAE4AUV8_9HYPH|nr:flagellar hook-associated family protein [Amorphus orientalis]MDQ0317577.1 flagellar hook-associated protein 3 FlgL [Amorphus orientalis]